MLCFVLYLLDQTSDKPGVMQVYFSNESNQTSPMMTWCYSEPRIVTEIHALPVPFHLTKEYSNTLQLFPKEVSLHIYAT